MKSKNILLWVVTIVIGIIAIVGCYTAFQRVNNLGASGDIVTNIVTYLKGLKIGDSTQKTIVKQMASGQNTVLLYTNNTGYDVYVDYGEMNILTGSTASSTSKVSVFATTSTSISTVNNYATLANGNTGAKTLIDSVLIATSSTATTTSSIYASKANAGNGAILVPTGYSVWGMLQQNTSATTGCYGVTGLCEVATSTRRGFDPVFMLSLHKNVAGTQGF